MHGGQSPNALPSDLALTHSPQGVDLFGVQRKMSGNAQYLAKRERVQSSVAICGVAEGLTEAHETVKDTLIERRIQT